MSKVSNCLQMIQVLMARPKVKIQDLADELEVKPRMVRVYRDELEKAGIYIQSERGINGGYSLDSRSILPIRNFTSDEVQELQIAIQSYLSKQPNLETTLNNALEKIRAFQRDQELSSRHFYFANDHLINTEIGNESEHYKQLFDAFSQRRKVLIAYEAASTSEVTTRTIHPYAFVVYDESMYCVAFCELKQAMRTFKIIRIHSLKQQKERYTIPQAFDIREQFPKLGFIQEPQKVELIIKSPTSNLVKESIYGIDQVIEPLENNAIRFKATLNGSESIKRWILGMGTNVQVIGPATLKQEIHKEIKQMLNQYKDLY
ncbi:Predicted DNA-binding transcriptional regulator YafY, contains an HTH and WYL domains [Pelagirhabdus alkalitolerans]|uniref:Predicted DNA-binding transcriptional regulator YafY, contains an HTH and WYL domains n=1 Tax=Pelagirhabdus alkalitolerans TaxID=1612202 RepID=A0A1G6GN63_9BACI|nr:transcriptional regulator [Pelagirhabdus alkalitolerans]SDB83427.1 Predicted DNA-binding transcriptional regulator YafY, contains an HTH and WYL domains [Pelagirhabdus alkalitolerans]